MNPEKRVHTQQLPSDRIEGTHLMRDDTQAAGRVQAWGPRTEKMNPGVAPMHAFSNPLLHNIHGTSNVNKNLGNSLPSSQSPLQGIELPPASMLMNLDIPSTNFMKAFNFEALSDGSSHEQGVNGDVRFSMDDNGIQLVEVNEGLETGSIPEDDCDISADLVDQQQAREQAHLLQRFKQLRQWQQQQQDLLLLQQQQQLEALREEQTKVQRMMARQREVAWGGAGLSTKNGYLNGSVPPMLPTTPPMSTPRKNGQLGTINARAHGGSTIPQALAQGAVTLARMHQLPDIGFVMPSSETNGKSLPPLNHGTRTSRVTNEMQLQGLHNGRPVPNLRERSSTPVEYRENGNPNLDSDCNIDSMSNITDEGVFPLPDTASEASDNPPILQPPSAFQKVSVPQHAKEEHRTHIQNTKNNSKSQSHHTIDANMADLGQVMWNRVNLVNGHTVEGNFNNNHQDEMDSQDDVYDENGFESIDGISNEPNNKHHMTKNEQDRSRPHHSEAFKDGNGELVPVLPAYAEEGAEDDQLLMEEVATKTFDDKPVSGIGGQKKTFEQLLEEELRKEEEKLLSGRDPEETSSNVGKKTFLRKGQGMARFGVGGAKIQKPTRPHSGEKDRKPSSGVTSSSVANNPLKGKNLKMANSDYSKLITKKPPMSQKPSVTKQLPSKQSHQGLSLKPRQKSQVAPSQGQVTRPIIHSDDKKSAPHVAAVVGPSDQLPAKENTSSVGDKNEDITKGTSKGGKNKCIVSDTSFVRKMKEREENEEVEQDELEEFEILEQFADDNASFLSNVSAVNRIVEQQRAQTHVTTGGPERIQQQLQHVPPVVTDASKTDDEIDDLSNDSTDGEESSSSSSCSEKEVEQSLLDDTLTKEVTPTDSKTSHVRILHRKVASLEKRSPVKQKSPSLGEISPGSLRQLEKVQQWVSDEEHEEDDMSDHPQGTAIQIHWPFFTSGHSDSAPSDNEPEKNKSKAVSSVQLHSRFQNSLPNGMHQNTHQNGDFSLEQMNNAQKQGHTVNLPSSDAKQPLLDQVDKCAPPPGPDFIEVQKKLSFGDDEAWDDSSVMEEEEEDSETKRIGIDHQLAAVRKGDSISTGLSTIRTAENITTVGAAGDAPLNSTTPPPTSRLVTKLFPKLKVDKAIQQRQQHEQQEQQKKLDSAKQIDPVNGVQTKALRDKLVELEREIERFRVENSSLAKLRKEREEGLTELQKQMEDLEKLKTEELKRLQDFKSEEMKKIKHERKMFDQYQKAVRAMPDKKEREEIEDLKQQVTNLQDEMKRKEQRWTSSSTRLRDRVEALEMENTELKEEIQVLERKRLEAWQQKEAAISAQKEGNKKMAGSQPKAPSPQIKPSSAVYMDNALRLSSDAMLDGLGEAEEAHPASGIPDAESMPMARAEITRKPITSSPRTKSEGGTNEESQKPLLRKTALFSITNTVDKGNDEYEEIQHADGKVEKVYSNGAREILFSNGTRKQVSADGQSIIVSFFNGDIKQIMPDQRVVYYYADAQTTHTTYPDGLEILQFPNQQVEKHYPDGTKEISFPDQTIKYLFPSGIEESIFPDGTVIRIEKNGDKTMEFPNGQREIHTQQYKRREYPDGTVKTVYPDGRQETRYSSGRLRVKDKDGHIIVDKRT